MMNHPQPSTYETQKRMSLREEAMARRHAALQQQSKPKNHESIPNQEDEIFNSFRGSNSSVFLGDYNNNNGVYAASSPPHWQQQQQYYQHDQMYTNTGMMLYNNPPPILHAPPHYVTSSLPTPSAPPAEDASTVTSTAADEARKSWRQHGDSLGQRLEERRTALLSHNANSPYNTNSTFYSVRIQNAETRTDASGSTFTTYIIHVETLSSSAQPRSYTIEHRYSEFSKLNAELNANHIYLRTSFPTKHWAGRMGNWTPSLTLAPAKNEELVMYRKIKLDIWLVELCELLAKGDQPPQTPQGFGASIVLRGDIRELVLDFLSEGSSCRAPCDSFNFVDWDGLRQQSQPPQQQPCEDDNYNNTNGVYDANGNERNYHRYSNTYPSPCIDNNTLGTKHAAGTEKHISNPLSFTLGSSIRQATYTVMKMCCHPRSGTNSPLAAASSTSSSSATKSQMKSSDQSIPLDLLHSAKGLCFLTVVKAGFVISGRFGTGLIIRRIPRHPRQSNNNSNEEGQEYTWSAPSAIGTIGMGYGALMGGDITNYLIVLTTDKAVMAFANKSGKAVNLGGEFGVSVGPLGRSATGNVTASTSSGGVGVGGGGRGEGGIGGLAPVYAYAHSKGLFMGISLEGSIISSRPDVNAKFYGRPMDASDLLFGNIQNPPRAAQPLYDALEEAMKVNIPPDGFRPSRVFDGQQQQRMSCGVRSGGIG
mmetsp:Transcript_12884/g.17245  ORF Transcript_12884/g.17245 Transcript_12884/m.17245 type:complete len:705 (-) Transcript_12884:461-2575(-)